MMSPDDERDRKRDDFFVFREAAGAEELMELFRLRYREYRGSGLETLVPENRYGIDCDCYDLRARHCGLFQIRGNREHPVGYLRVVEDRESPETIRVALLVEQVPGLRHITEVPPPHPFPLMSYIPEADVLSTLYDQVKSRGERVVEVSRLALEAGFRCLTLARHMVDSVIAVLAFHYQVEHAVWCCDSSNRAFYRLYGFELLAGTSESDFLGLGLRSACVYGTLSQIPQAVRVRLAEMAEVYSKLGCIPYTRSGVSPHADLKTVSERTCPYTLVST